VGDLDQRLSRELMDASADVIRRALAARENPLTCQLGLVGKQIRH
jgi:hypothetical protein